MQNWWQNLAWLSGISIFKPFKTSITRVNLRSRLEWLLTDSNLHKKLIFQTSSECSFPINFQVFFKISFIAILNQVARRTWRSVQFFTVMCALIHVGRPNTVQGFLEIELSHFPVLQTCRDVRSTSPLRQVKYCVSLWKEKVEFRIFSRTSLRSPEAGKPSCGIALIATRGYLIGSN